MSFDGPDSGGVTILTVVNKYDSVDSVASRADRLLNWEEV